MAATMLVRGRYLSLFIDRTNLFRILKFPLAGYSTLDDKSSAGSPDKSKEQRLGGVGGESNPGIIETESTSIPVSGLDKVFSMFERVDKASIGADLTTQEQSAKKSASFLSLLRRSKLMQIGHPDGRVVVGTIIETLDDDLYIDFGGKFHCVCKKPRTRPEEYHRGVKVRLRLRDLEMSSKFLGGERDITLLEADATLIGLLRTSRITGDRSSYTRPVKL